MSVVSYDTTLHVYSYWMFSATLQTRISDVIASTDNDNLCTTTSNQFNFPNTVQAETLLGSSCDEISETQEDEEDNYDDDVGQMDPIDSYGSTSGKF